MTDGDRTPSRRGRSESDNGRDLRMLTKTLFGYLLIIRGVEGPYPFVDNPDGRVVLQRFLQTSRPNHNSSDVWIDAKNNDRSLVLQDLCQVFGGHAACLLVIIQDVAQFASGRNGKTRTDDYGQKSVGNCESNRSNQRQRVIGCKNQSLVPTRDHFFKEGDLSLNIVLSCRSVPVDLQSCVLGGDLRTDVHRLPQKR